MTSLRFVLPRNFGWLELTQPVLTHLEQQKQRKWLSQESGGQLFANFETPSVVTVVEATGPRATDKRSRYSYVPDRIAERAEISDRYARGLHFVGDWHTHRQQTPKPSRTDEQSIQELVRHSSHDLAGFLLIVVGLAEFPAGIHVQFQSRTGSTILRPIDYDKSHTVRCTDEGI